MRRLGILAALLGVAAYAGPGSYFVYFGTYTGKSSQGIYVSRFDAATGKLETPQLAATASNPSFLAVHPNGRFLYAVGEDDQGSASAFAIDPGSGKLTLLDTVSSKGSSPCYIRVDRSGKAALVANYGSGTFAALPIDTDGRLHEASAVIQDHGSGPNRNRQEGPHAHSLNPSPDDRYAVGADLGIDELLVFRFDPGKGALTQGKVWRAAPGSGPRHYTFHPNGKFAYVTNEMASTVVAFDWDSAAGELREIQKVSTLPKHFSGENTTADVQVEPAGRFLYVSNRGDNTIAAFSIAAGSGRLTFVERTPTQGSIPRGFGIDPTGSFLIAANQKSDNVVVFRVDRSTGRLISTGQAIHLGTPVCVKFVAVR